MSIQLRKLIWCFAIVAATVFLFSFIAVRNYLDERANPAAAENRDDKDGLKAQDGKGDSAGQLKDEWDDKMSVPSYDPNSLTSINGDGGDDYSSIPGVTDGKSYGQKLVEDSSINILIMGEDKVNQLYDTIGVISIDKKGKKVKIIMIPRDMYIQYNKKVLRVLEKAGKLNVPGIFKINFAHHIGPMMKYDGKFRPYYSINFLADVIKEKFNIEIDDYVKLTTDGFPQVVDLFGGVDLYVPYRMYYDDPLQDLHIRLEKGYQHLDGKQAEGFVRFRQGYDENGVFHSYDDVERKKNQLAFLDAFIKQHGTISNINKVPELLKILGKNVQHSIGLGDVLFKYMGVATDVVADKYVIEKITLSSEKEKYINGSKYMILVDE